jgi:circadian clock protein KaiB
MGKLRCKFRLYVCGKSSQKREIEKALRNIMEEKSNNSISIKVIDLLECPESASADNVIATPTLIKVSPDPVVKIIGDVTDREQLFKCLQMAIGV